MDRLLVTGSGSGLIRHPQAEREQVVRLYESGLGSKRIARRLGLDDSTVRLWLRRYRRYGAESLRPYWRSPGKKGSRTEREKLHQVFGEAVKLYAATSMSQVDICRQLRLFYSQFNAYLNRYHRSLIERRKRDRGSVRG